MHYSDYWREQAAHYRQQAETSSDAEARREYIELANVCEDYANQIDDLRASG